jgi:Spy/CpxP family protein refolding chaperone
MLLAFLLVSAAASAQSPQPASDPIADQLFPPELVMQYSQEINLTDDQSKAVRDEILKAQPTFMDLQLAMQSERGKLVQLLKARPVDESAVLAEVDKVLDRERAIKKTQLSLLVRIKNQLTAAQQEKLMALRRTPS